VKTDINRIKIMCRYEFDIIHGTVENSVKFDFIVIAVDMLVSLCLLGFKLNVHTKLEKT